MLPIIVRGIHNSTNDNINSKSYFIMSTVGSELMACPDVQAELEAFFNTCDAATIGFRSPFNEFLWNPVNRKGLQQLINPGPGKLKNVSLRYDQAIPLSQVQGGTMEDITCTASSKRGDLTTPYTIDPDDILYIEELMDPKDFYYACRNNPQIILRKIALMMKALREATYKKTADDFVSNAMWGNWGEIVEDSGYTVNVSEELVVSTKKTIGGDSDVPNPFTMEIIDNALMMTQYCDMPFITGGNALFEYYRRIQAGCCSQNGINLADIQAKYGKVVTWDKWLQASSALGDTDLSLAIMPGALQMLYFNAYEGDAEFKATAGLKVGSNYDSFVISDPVSGMPMNVLVSDNCRKISIFIHTCTKVVSLPADMFATGEDLEGVTFVNKIKVSN